MNRIAVVTGAGSGVGRAIVHQLAAAGYDVALVGRTEPSLAESIALAPPSAKKSRLLPCPCDVADEAAVLAMAGHATNTLGPATVLVNNAGTNLARRALEVLSPEDFRKLIDVNLNGAFYCVAAFLPGMRQTGGTIVNIISDAGLQANAKAGAAYVASKFGLRGLTQSINAEERQHGVRACAIFPGDINTPLLDKRPTPPSAEARVKMLQPEDVAACALLAITLPDRAVIEELTIRPR